MRKNLDMIDSRIRMDNGRGRKGGEEEEEEKAMVYVFDL